MQRCELQPARFLCPWDSPGKNTGVGYCAFLQGIFVTQGLNLCRLGLLHWQAGCHSCHLESTQSLCALPQLKKFLKNEARAADRRGSPSGRYSGVPEKDPGSGARGGLPLWPVGLTPWGSRPRKDRASQVSRSPNKRLRVLQLNQFPQQDHRAGRGSLPGKKGKPQTRPCSFCSPFLDEKY